jgi:2,5-diamino-6-(ribosylamino)-4(3H)-pyrimidinone 5'-phosphate reductase
MTADGKIDTVERRGAQISSRADATRVDRLRAGSDAVMIGGYTLLHEDPSLTVKSPELRAQRLELGLPENPAKVGIVSKIPAPGEGPTIPSDGKFLNTGPARTVIFTTEQADATQIDRLRTKGAEVLVMGERRVDLARALRHLRETGVRTLMVEGGGTLNASLVELGLVDEIYLYIAPLIFGGASAPTLAGGPGLVRDKAIPLRLLDVTQLDDGGLVVRYAVTKPTG